MASTRPPETLLIAADPVLRYQFEVLDADALKGLWDSRRALSIEGAQALLHDPRAVLLDVRTYCTGYSTPREMRSPREELAELRALLWDVRKTLGVQPGESLIDRCRHLAALEARVMAPTPEEMERLREWARSYGPIQLLGLVHPADVVAGRLGSDGRVILDHPTPQEPDDAAPKPIKFREFL